MTSRYLRRGWKPHNSRGRSSGRCSSATACSPRKSSRSRSRSSAGRASDSARSSSRRGRSPVPRSPACSPSRSRCRSSSSMSPRWTSQRPRSCPRTLARRYSALPMGFLPDDSLLVAVADPTNVLHWDELRLALGVPIRFGIAPPDAIDAAIAFVHQESRGSRRGRRGAERTRPASSTCTRPTATRPPSHR